MMESSFPLELALGMHYYASDTPGIGGRLRTDPEDFIVEEIPPVTGDDGPYLILRLTKKDWDQQRALREIARRLGISYRRIGFAGTKDKHAVTSQVISIPGISEEDIGRVRLRDIRLEVVGRSHSPITLGSHTANRFHITIREVVSEGLAGIVAQVSEVCKTAVPNYFGIQRFGVMRPITHTVGRHLLKRDYEGAVLCYIGEAFPGEPEEVRSARLSFLSSGDTASAIREFPLPLAYERSMLHYLDGKPGDYRGALAILPPKILSLFVSAYQSWLFNTALSARIREGGTLTDPLPGDRLVFEHGREDRVTERNIGSARLQLQRGRCRIALRMPGCSPSAPEYADHDVMASLLEDDGIREEDFCSVRELVNTRFEGAARPISLSADISSGIGEDFVRLSFSLPPGQYATTICREYMKADPLMMI
ncbi:MAG: tRNA pseudouridine(13) synthase TruD [Methanomicrobiales archaeon]|nr:tRNA pseudouridine(13) synthase TruD [Methanomicrobiales archaeon]